ncbi:double zinc ribbon domain-containing protein [Geobacter sulfurreducens]|uniref:double zinc ribbon domain-containing protein n=1 Tax=Geobacter sulfurreducens TaxID=35554 RepID=UPI003D9BF1E8
MALIKCPECSREISDKAESCPQCGCPVVNNDEVSLRSMEWVSEEDVYIMIKCPQCGKVSKIKKSMTQKHCSGYKVIGTGACSCGIEFDEVYKDPDEDRVKCPSCGSFQVSAGGKGFGLGKAAAGGLLLGPVGLLGGLLGSKKIVCSCLKCGHNWCPSK